MPIEALPQATVRAIGSTSVISDPCSVVKELVDNALDSGSSSIFIEISSNTVDVIQIKDNGHGIPSEDHPNVCKHACTSKIHTIDDLKNVGGTSLGFRGEALASIAEMSGGITITTRVASSVTGSCVKYQRDGQILQSQRASHPVGTTIRVVDFIKHIPVRRQVVLKSVTKILSKIKRLLQSYAIAQPSKRFSFKVLKAKNESNNWMYAPSTEASLPDAAAKIFGRELSSCLVEKMLSSDMTSNMENGPAQSVYSLSSLLPKSDADITKVNGTGQFISVDGRPLSKDTGIGQSIAKLFKSHIRAAASRNEITKTITDPFLFLEITCPRGSYDVNIEPGKDDVIFEDRDIVLDLVESLLEDHYGPLPDSRGKSEVKSRNPKTTQTGDEFDLLLNRPNSRQSPIVIENAEDHVAESPVVVPFIETTTHSNLSSNDTGSRPLKIVNGNYHTKSAESRNSRSINPWSASKMNMSLRTPQHKSGSQPARPGDLSCESSPGNVRQNAPQSAIFQSSPESPEFLSPPASRLTSTSPGGVARQTNLPSSQVSPTQRSSVSSVQKAARQRDKERYGNGALDTWFTRTTQASLDQDPLSHATEEEIEIPTISQLAEQRFGAKPSEALPDTAAESAASQTKNNTQDPNSSPDGNTPDEPGYQGGMDSGRGFPVLERWAANLREGLNSESQTELEKALDFEQRKKEAMRQYRNRQEIDDTPLSSQVSTAVSHSPHHNRFLKAKAALASDRPFAIEPAVANLIPVNDPRAYLIRHSVGQDSTDPAKAQRRQTSKMPFERIPEGCDLHSVGISIPVDLSKLKESSKASSSLYDLYMRNENEDDTFTASNVEYLAPFWNGRLNSILKQNYKSRTGPQTSTPQVDVSSAVINHSTQLK
ncbi:DNA mismatch repair protein C-terminal [Penicillium angulare]|uniref:DNA mismatch repair protein C-terminal n=1 Tax=Penicillium angulare TaxID=116970 RepID=A0A9W9K9B9_9EURO|nr:DNA mismatch repair protein C-terminal [Penicillium angulare]KAJ5097798.1 DNA mismatch repair protein C-terminal [Penicillium angulare]